MTYLEKNATQLDLFRYRRWPFVNSNSYNWNLIDKETHWESTNALESRQIQPIYGYYYIWRQLWYVPLYFSIYFVFYVGSLVLKAISRHRVYFPQTVAAAVAPVVKALEKVVHNYGQISKNSPLQQTHNYVQPAQSYYDVNKVSSYSQSMKNYQRPEMNNYQHYQMHNKYG